MGLVGVVSVAEGPSHGSCIDMGKAEAHSEALAYRCQTGRDPAFGQPHCLLWRIRASTHFDPHTLASGDCAA